MRSIYKKNYNISFVHIILNSFNDINDLETGIQNLNNILKFLTL